MSRRVSIYVVVIYLVSTHLRLSRHTLLSISLPEWKSFRNL